MKSFEGYLDFYNFLKDNDIHGKDTVFLPFLNACKNIGKGCSCAKQKRIDKAVSEYLSLGSRMSKEYADPIKLFFQVTSINFNHNGGTFFSI